MKILLFLLVSIISWGSVNPTITTTPGDSIIGLLDAEYPAQHKEMMYKHILGMPLYLHEVLLIIKTFRFKYKDFSYRYKGKDYKLDPRAKLHNIYVLNTSMFMIRPGLYELYIPWTPETPDK
mgnify:FL=1|jgi:hypothetical protein